MESELGAVQHLLRHLNDLPNLRRNALVNGLFQRGDSPDHIIHARIRTIVANALDLTLSQHGKSNRLRAVRWRAIVQECDLDGRRREVVAEELGLSERQFYRERNAAHKSMATLIVRELAQIAQTRSALANVASKAELQLELADALRRVGSFEDAERVLNLLANAPIETATRLGAINDLLDLYLVDQERHDDALHLISIARSIGSEIHDRDHTAGAELLAIEASNAWAHGATPDYERYTKDLLLHVARSHATRRSCELSLRKSLTLARVFLHCGDAAESRRLLASAKSFLESEPSASATLSLDLLLVVGEEKLLEGSFGEAVAAFSELLSASRRERAPYYTACASSSLASAYSLLGDTYLVETHAGNALALGEDRDWLHPITAARMALSHVSLEHDPRRSLMLSKQLRSCLSNGFLYILDEMTADALTRLGDFHEALTFSERARSGLEKHGLLRYLGVTERVRAEAYTGLHQQNAARDAITRAVELLERHGTMPALARAYELSAQLTNNSTHSTRARELRQLVHSRFDHHSG